MSSEVSNRYHGVLYGRISGTTVSGGFSVPAGTYFRGQLTFSNYVGTSYCAVELRDASGTPVCTLGANSALGSNNTNTDTKSVFLDEGTYTWATLQNSTTGIVVSHFGICFRK